MDPRRSLAPCILAGFFGFALPPPGGVGVGLPAPELKGDVWLNVGDFRGTTLADFRRSAVFLYYWQTW